MMVTSGNRVRFAVGLLCCVLGSPALAHQLTNGRITVVLNDPSLGATVEDQDRIDSIAWIDSAGTSTGNLAANGGGFCGDALEFFGEAYGETEGTSLGLVVGGTVSTWTAPPGALTGTSQTTGTNACVTLGGKAKTIYTLSRAANRVNVLRVRRTFTFDSKAAVPRDNLRAYVPRLPIARFAATLVPLGTGSIETVQATCCGTATEISGWNGKWFAEQDSTGHGMVVIRDRSSTLGAVLAVDNDSVSASNNTSIVLTLPAGGWSGQATETEWLCFYDGTSWPAARQTTGRLPVGCAVPTP